MSVTIGGVAIKTENKAYSNHKILRKLLNVDYIEVKRGRAI